MRPPISALDWWCGAVKQENPDWAIAPTTFLTRTPHVVANLDNMVTFIMIASLQQPTVHTKH